MNKEELLKDLNERSVNTLMETLGIVFTEIGEDYLKGEMPVNASVHQPFGMLHGGASIALAESLGSCLSNLFVQEEGSFAVGINVNSNHLKAKKKGVVIGTARILRKGTNLHFIEAEICDEEGNIICHTTMTNMIIKIDNE